MIGHVSKTTAQIIEEFDALIESISNSIRPVETDVHNAVAIWGELVTKIGTFEKEIRTFESRRRLRMMNASFEDSSGRKYSITHLDAIIDKEMEASDAGCVSRYEAARGLIRDVEKRIDFLEALITAFYKSDNVVAGVNRAVVRGVMGRNVDGRDTTPVSRKDREVANAGRKKQGSAEPTQAERIEAKRKIARQKKEEARNDDPIAPERAFEGIEPPKPGIGFEPAPKEEPKEEPKTVVKEEPKDDVKEEPKQSESAFSRIMAGKS